MFVVLVLVVVVVVVRPWIVNGKSVSINRYRMQLIKEAERLGVRLPAFRHPRVLDDEELFIIEGSPGAQRPDGRSAKNGF